MALKKSAGGYISLHKKAVIAIIAFLVVSFTAVSLFRKGSSQKVMSTTSQSVSVGKSYDFKALNNQGGTLSSKVKLTVTTAEKTNTVIVKDQSFLAKNHKLFLILNFDIKNDVSSQVNLIPGDLFRLSYNGDEDNKYAPDLHNNLVPIAAISTKIDRVGFVVPDNIKVKEI